MAKIPLRAYNREIDTLIDNGRADEAIAHCRHILKYYPKHLDTYRLLGKAFMESQRYSEAADIMQRVLSSVPDDFISQIGMSIIREDEGNLDAAIWHMERAHEIQPSNAAIQDELRRLYGRRDGVEPPKIRLTRGALVRMYARGELYPQAIAEIRAALAENPQRIDLEIIQARMYFLSGQRVEATEVCSRLVSKLPYCFEANRILADILPGTSRAEDATIYQQRVYALDPYLMHRQPGAITSNEVSDSEVMVEHLVYDASQSEIAAPEWTQNLGREWTEPEPEAEAPDWMKAEPEEPVEQEQPEAEAPQADIPDWMVAAGWKTASGEEQPPTVEETPTEEEIAPADLPDWLKTIAPEMEAPEGEEGDQEAAQWFDQLVTNGGPAAEVDLPESPVEAVSPVTDPSETPDWLAELAPQQTTPATPPLEGEVPDWLSELTAAPVEETPTESEASEAASWLPEILDEEASTEADQELAATELPDWLKSLEPTSETDSEIAPISTLESETPIEDVVAEAPLDFQPEDLELEGAPTDFATEPSAETSSMEMDDIDSAMAWLENLAAKQGADEETLITRPEDRVETPPEWIQSAVENEPAEGEPEATIAEEAPVAPADQEPLSTAEEPRVIETGVMMEQAEEVPQAEAPVVSENEGGQPESQDVDDAFAWLEGLAAKQGAQEGTLITPPEERSEVPPEWISELGADTDETTAPEIGEGQPEKISPLEDLGADLPDWLEEALGEDEPAAPTIETSTWIQEEDLASIGTEAQIEDLTSEGLPAELPVLPVEELQESIQANDIEVPAESVEEPPAPVEDLEFESTSEVDEVAAALNWSEELPEAGTDEPEIAGKAEEELLPDWLKGLVGEEPAEASVDQQEPAPVEENVEDSEVPEWLQSLQKQVEQNQDIPDFQGQLPVSPAIPLETAASHGAETAISSQGGDFQTILQAARNDLERGKIDPAVEKFSGLIQSGQFLEESIHDLRDALYRYPVDISLWQTLGDAYAHSNMLQEALDAYTKAEELLR